MDMMEYGLLTEEEMNAIDQGSELTETGNEEVKSAAAGAAGGAAGAAASAGGAAALPGADAGGKAGSNLHRHVLLARADHGAHRRRAGAGGGAAAEEGTEISFPAAGRKAPKSDRISPAFPVK